jgi:hypothetical protein
MSNRKRSTAAGKPAVILPSIVTEQDRAIVARREAGESRRAIAASLGITVCHVQRSEHRIRRDAEGRSLLAKCPDDIEGLGDIGILSISAAWLMRGHHYHYDSPAITRLSDAAALGRQYWARTGGATDRRMEEIDRILGLLGIAWSPIERTPKPKPREVEQPQEAEQPAMLDGAAWSSIVRRVGEIEQAVGTAVLENDPYRNDIDRVSMRLSFLTGYLEGYFEKRQAHKPMRDIAPEADSGEDLETAGNLVCLPGVKLIDVLPSDGGAA